MRKIRKVGDGGSLFDVRPIRLGMGALPVAVVDEHFGDRQPSARCSIIELSVNLGS